MPVAKGRPSIALEDILSVVSEFDILAHYINITKIPCVIQSPLRLDSKPSFGLYSPDGSKIQFRDFMSGETGGTFDLLSKLWNVPFIDVISIIYDNLPEFVEKNARIQKYQKSGEKKVTFSKDIDLKCKIRNWQDWDIKFWNQYGISTEWLEFGKIYPISHIFIIDVVDNETKVIPAEKYAYVFVEFKDGVESLKIYQPFSEFYKWRNKHDSSVWDLWEQLPETGENLIITSSRKDALCLWANTKIPSVSLQSETYLPKKHVVDELKSRFKNIYVLYDNDWKKEKNTGRDNGMLLAKTFGLIYLEIPKEADEKDPSDIYKRYGKHTLVKMVETLIKLNNKR